MVAIALSTLFTGLLMWLVCLPLVKRQVPMNKMYGFRIPAAFESEERWYDINAYGGRQMSRWSWVVTSCGIAGLLIPREYADAYILGNITIAGIALLIPTVQTSRWSRR